MKRLLLWIAVLTILLSSGITLAGRAGIGAPKPAFARWFTYPDGKPCLMPCLFGIRLGVTKLDDVRGLLDSHPMTISRDKLGATGFEPVDEHFDFFSAPNLRVSVGIWANINGVVTKILIYQPKNTTKLVSLSDLLLVFGFPSGVSLDREYYYHANDIVFKKIIAGVSVDSPNCVFSPSSLVTDITLYSSKTIDQKITIYQWEGFSKQTYLARYYIPKQIAHYACNP